jgi:hypothetical protein
MVVDVALHGAPRDWNDRQPSHLAPGESKRASRTGGGNPKVSLYVVEVQRRIEENASLRLADGGEKERRPDRRWRIRAGIELLPTRRGCAEQYHGGEARAPGIYFQACSFNHSDI